MSALFDTAISKCFREDAYTARHYHICDKEKEEEDGCVVLDLSKESYD